ncbi:NAD-dependent epimerase/dehydratase family protein [Streptomyces sp. LHD-70]|uniref:NAD-dependent epimerase/dehydratase family protein n=1 Tax=Streptomyces sp. LHD-70 TaxID=3072140 RepID=UPI00280EA9BC|nr:NAD-dependent epimerase/dehydratase family protein [Streptomyces sp. LHD-70]MDQ8706417.1 NAD-dependent epimerase/dehydratase family protein [Streptomyces sp. LHD-70]
MTHALVIGATGQIGRSAVRALAQDGWDVTAASRGATPDADRPEGVRTARLDREDDAALARLIGDGVDVVVDVVAYGRGHARQLRALSDRIGSAVVISSAAVYEDEQGRSFLTQDEPDGHPRYPVPLPESYRRLAPGETYGGRKVALEDELLGAGDTLPTTLLRAGAVHGPHCTTPRELYFVKRALDGRPRRILAYGGASRFHPASVHNIAELVRLAAARPGSRVLNAADPAAPAVAEIGAAIDALLGVESETVLIPGEPPAPTVGSTPWSLAHPLVLDMSAARELGYRPVVTYERSLPETVEWLAARLHGKDWREAFPVLAAAYDPMGDLFDYEAEDAWLTRRGKAV